MADHADGAAAAIEHVAEHPFVQMADANHRAAVLVGQARQQHQDLANVLLAVDVDAGQERRERIDDQEAGRAFLDESADKRHVRGDAQRPPRPGRADLADMEQPLGIGARRQQPGLDGVVQVVLGVGDDDAAGDALRAVRH